LRTSWLLIESASGFHVPQNSVFNVLFQVAVLESEEAEQIWVAENEVGREFVFLAQPFQFQRASSPITQNQTAMLEETTLPLKDVTERAGLGDQSTLWRAFMKDLGLTPAEYRHRFAAGHG
jgi:AraC-like DNA-binding protein